MIVATKGPDWLLAGCMVGMVVLGVICIAVFAWYLNHPKAPDKKHRAY